MHCARYSVPLKTEVKFVITPMKAFPGTGHDIYHIVNTAKGHHYLNKIYSRLIIILNHVTINDLRLHAANNA